MSMQSIKDLSKDDVLAVLGLETKQSTAGSVLQTLGIFGVGLLVGAGVALLLAPKSGSELRDDIRAKVIRDPAASRIDGVEQSS